VTVASGLRHAVFLTDAGWVGLLSSGQGLRRLTLPKSSAGEAYLELGGELAESPSSPRFFEGLIERLRRYFAGEKVTFPDILDLSGASPFQRRVFEVTRRIPYGETRSYRWVAREAGKPLAARAVGQAMGSNPVPIIIPCHRVTSSGGGLGGFGGGLEMKRYLLALEAGGNF